MECDVDITGDPSALCVPESCSPPMLSKSSSAVLMSQPLRLRHLFVPFITESSARLFTYVSCIPLTLGMALGLPSAIGVPKSAVTRLPHGVRIQVSSLCHCDYKWPVILQLSKYKFGDQPMFKTEQKCELFTTMLYTCKLLTHPPPDNVQPAVKSRSCWLCCGPVMTPCDTFSSSCDA
jgi:hypothetical protein